MPVLLSQTLKRDWELESNSRLKDMCEELCEKHETEMIALQKSLEMDLEKVRAELGLLSVENVQYKSKCHGLGGSCFIEQWHS